MSDVPRQLLREVLRDQTAPPSSPACLDAGTLAAWFDGTLSRRDRAIAESHAATCARCQAMLAATVKTAPAMTRKWWQTTTVRWLVPIAITSAAALVLWVKTPVQRTAFEARRSEQPSALVDAAPSPAPNAVPSPAAAAPASPPQTARRLDRPADSKDEKARVEDSVAPRQEQPGAQASSERDARAAAPAAAPAPSRPEALLRAIPSAAESAAAPFRQLAKETGAPLDVVSPDRNIRWRVAIGGSVARSIDGGSTWESQSTGVAATLTAGAAPTSTTCWLVGRAGIVLLSTDGRTWQRVSFPETVDLVAIRASDASNAIATAADGRTFTTSDAGRTWRMP